MVRKDMSGKLIDFDSYAVRTTLKKLLQDKTTKKNIIWATNTREYLGSSFIHNKEIGENIFTKIGFELEPRTSKEENTQSERTKKRAEVFTPSWVVNQMNNSIDEEWFGRKNVFNVEEGTSWKPITENIKFPEDKTWQDYIKSTRLEITCGEAPFLVSRYDVSSGEKITKTINRMGILDRKLRIVNENVTAKKDWINWAVKSVQNCYGYEYQGDSLLIARINVLLTFVEYYEEKWNEKVDSKTLLKLANIISWNIWQMDGLTGTVPFSDEIKSNEQVSLFETNESTEINCRIFDWKANKSQEFNELREK